MPGIPDELRALLQEFGPDELKLPPIEFDDVDSEAGSRPRKSRKVRKGRKKGARNGSLAHASGFQTPGGSLADASGFQAPGSPKRKRGAGEPGAGQPETQRPSVLLEVGLGSGDGPPIAVNSTLCPDLRRDIPRQLLSRPVEDVPLTVRWANRVEPWNTNWLWPGRIPLGRLVLLAGDPGIGKSLLALDIAARVSSGAPWPGMPDSAREPQNVILFSLEDDPHDTIVPRLIRAGAARERILIVEGVRNSPPFDPTEFRIYGRRFRAPQDLRVLMHAIDEIRPVPLVIFDPIMAYCGTGDGRGVSGVHSMLAPLAEMAMMVNTTMLGTIHLRRGGCRALYRLAGDPAFSTLARAVWGVMPHPRQKGKRLLLPVKMNLTDPGNSLPFRIDREGKLVWDGAPIQVDPDEVFAAEARGGKVRQIDRAQDWLCEVLADGSLPAAEVKCRGMAHGLSERTLERAYALLKIDSRRAGFGGNGGWNWSLPPGPEANGAAVEAQPDEEQPQMDTDEHR